jgi:hypothetical protein
MIRKLQKNASKTKYCAPQDIMKVALRVVVKYQHGFFSLVFHKQVLDKLY